MWLLGVGVLSGRGGSPTGSWSGCARGLTGLLRRATSTVVNCVQAASHLLGICSSARAIIASCGMPLSSSLPSSHVHDQPRRSYQVIATRGDWLRGWRVWFGLFVLLASQKRWPSACRLSGRTAMIW